jgi:hypothetical protein
MAILISVIAPQTSRTIQTRITQSKSPNTTCKRELGAIASIDSKNRPDRPFTPIFGIRAIAIKRIISYTGRSLENECQYCRRGFARVKVERSQPGL